MNLLLLTPEDLLPDGTARLTGRRLVHARDILRVSSGDTLRCGLLGGTCGTGTVTSLTADALTLALTLGDPPPPRPGVDLLLALPRPKALKRLLPQLAQLGLDRVVLLNAARVEKSYFSSPALSSEVQRELLCQGLEQAQDTRLPEVLVRERFRPFVEDELDARFPGGERLLAHPAPSHAPVPPPARSSTRSQASRTLLAIGPEGGWVPFELELLQVRGFQLFSAG